MFWKKPKTENLTNRERYQRENQANFEKRMRAIMQIANRNMEKTQCGKHLPVRDTVVVPYNDLLRIWDIAERAKSETSVQ